MGLMEGQVLEADGFALVVCSRVNSRRMICCLAWKSGRQDEARGSGGIPTKISAESDSFESSDERALPADLLSCAAASSGALKRVRRDRRCWLFLPLQMNPKLQTRLSLDPKRTITMASAAGVVGMSQNNGSRVFFWRGEKTDEPFSTDDVISVNK